LWVQDVFRVRATTTQWGIDFIAEPEDSNNYAALPDNEGRIISNCPLQDCDALAIMN